MFSTCHTDKEIGCKIQSIPSIKEDDNLHFYSLYDCLSRI